MHVKESKNGNISVPSTTGCFLFCFVFLQSLPEMWVIFFRSELHTIKTSQRDHLLRCRSVSFDVRVAPVDVHVHV